MGYACVFKSFVGLDRNSSKCSSSLRSCVLRVLTEDSFLCVDRFCVEFMSESRAVVILKATCFRPARGSLIRVGLASHLAYAALAVFVRKVQALIVELTGCGWHVLRGVAVRRCRRRRGSLCRD